MKVMCITDEFMHLARLGIIPLPCPEMTEIYTVVQTVEHQRLKGEYGYIIEGLNPFFVWNVKKFIPLSDIDEDLIAEERWADKMAERINSHFNTP